MKYGGFLLFGLCTVPGGQVYTITSCFL